MKAIFSGLRPLDYVLAALSVAAGVYMMYLDITGGEHNLPHPQSTTTVAMLPVFLAVTVPILWRRRNILAVCAVTTAALAVHVLLFGWISRCGIVLPLSAALAYAVGRFAIGRREHLFSLVIILLLQIVTLARDASIDTILSALPMSVVGAALFYGIGRFVQVKVSKKERVEQPAAEAVAV